MLRTCLLNACLLVSLLTLAVLLHFTAALELGEKYDLMKRQTDRDTEDVDVSKNVLPKTPTLTSDVSGHLAQGSSVTFSCGNDSSGSFTYTLLKANWRKISRNREITVNNLTGSMAGDYICVASKDGVKSLPSNAVTIKTPKRFDPVNYYSKTCNCRDMPFIRKIPRGISPGSVIYVLGMANNWKASTISIDLYCGPHCSSRDTPLHISIRFRFRAIDHMVIDSMKHGAWQKPEYPPSFPFKRNAKFEVKIVCEPSSFKIYVNKKYVSKFFHRIDLEQATYIKVSEKFRLRGVRFEKHPLPYYYKIGGSLLYQGPTGKFYIDLQKPKQNKKSSSRLCEAAGGYLPKPLDRNELDYLKRFQQTFYLGMNDKHTEGRWVFDDKYDAMVTWSDWGGSNRGPDGGARENCACLMPHGDSAGFSDIHCASRSTSTVICEKSQDPVYQPMPWNYPAVPFIHKIPGGMKPGRVIYIDGHPLAVDHHDELFHIDLYCGPSCSPQVMPLHVKITMTVGTTYIWDTRGRIFLNSMKQGSWEKENELMNNYFMFAVKYKMKIVCEPSSFKIYVNRFHFATFFHRMDPAKATHIKIAGDTGLALVRFEEQI